VLEARGDLRFAQEAQTETLVTRKLRRRHLQGDTASPLRVICQVDRARRASPLSRSTRKPATTVPVRTSDDMATELGNRRRGSQETVGYDPPPMTDNQEQLSLQEQLEGIGAQLDWVRGYL
jgi:hypothetical protein